MGSKSVSGNAISLFGACLMLDHTEKWNTFTHVAVHDMVNFSQDLQECRNIQFAKYVHYMWSIYTDS